MIYALLFYTCSLTGTDCHYHFEADRMNLGTCMIQALQSGAKYSTEHPKRRIVHYKCTPLDRVNYYLGKNQA